VEPQLAELIAKGIVSVEFRHYAFLSGRSQWAAEASECAADQGSFWAYHDLLLKNQKVTFTMDQLKAWGNTLNLDSQAFGQCLDSHKYEEKVKQQAADAKKLGVTGTPTFVLNGKRLQLKQDPKNPDNPFVQVVEMVKQAADQ